MSVDKLHAQAERWLAQATDDLESAQLLTTAGKHATAAFLAQQAAEKAIKAVGFALDGDPWGHSITNLIDELSSEVGALVKPLRNAGQRLDKLYIPTRYPDALPEMVPAQAYSAQEANAALEDARLIRSAVATWLAQR